MDLFIFDLESLLIPTPQPSEVEITTDEETNTKRGLVNHQSPTEAASRPELRLKSA